MPDGASIRASVLRPRLDDALWNDCSVETRRGSGPGGQKRNKTSSAVRIVHRPSGIDAVASESRSQHDNLARARRRLLLAVATRLRRPGAEGLRFLNTFPGWVDVSPRAAVYPDVVAAVFDVLDERTWTLVTSADALGITTGGLSKFLTREDLVLASANDHRRRLGLRPLSR